MSTEQSKPNQNLRYHRGGWELRVTFDRKTHTKRVRAPETKAGRAEAERELVALVARVRAGHDGRMTVADLFDRYVAAHPLWKPTSRKTVRSHRALIVAALGTKPVCDVRRADVDAFYASLFDMGRKINTVRRYHATMTGMFGYAVEHGLITASPAFNMRLGRTGGREDLSDLPTMEEVAPELDRLPSWHTIDVAARLALATGARRGELCALRWSKVDLDAATVDIVAAISGGVRTTTKTGSSGYRTITIDAATVAMLRQWYAVSRERSFALGHRITKTSPVFPSLSDPTAHMLPENMSQAFWRHRVKSSVLATLRFHDFRHIHATALLRARVPVHKVAYRLGHASASMTLDVYAHAIPGDDGDAADVVAVAMGGAR